ncbi:hypothetical protein EFR57_11180 [Lactobacillus crispatus]|uniref:hypothetical protein n=1 Tax=Lactobacillus crispatus TaxID=47770 RepID=UPI0021A6D3CD|nr:hypothetical protein [Lactobacillus crispatus]MCT3535458.1 hypothetical protein [Lactobacillus crispatus]
MLVMKIIFNVLIAYLVICTVISIIRTVGAKREEWHVYNGQGMSFNQAFVRYFIKDATLGQVTI